MVVEFTNGKTVEATTGSGVKTICKASVTTCTLMELSITANILTTRKKAMENTTGLMVASMKAGGTRGNSMDSAFTLILKRILLNSVCGSSASVSNGSTKKKLKP